VDVSITEVPIIDPHNPDRVTGATRFVVKIASGQGLVDGDEHNSLTCQARTSYEKVNQSDIDGLYDIYWGNGQKFNLYNAAMGGALQGLIQMRDGNNTENFVGKIIGIGNTDPANPAAGHGTVTVQVTQKYLQDLNKGNLSDQGGVINLGNQEFYYDSWEYACKLNTTSGELEYFYTFTLSNDPKLNQNGITNDRVGKEAKIGASIDYQGVPFYMNQMNEWIRTFAQKFNAILHKGFDAYNGNGCNLFTGNMAADKEQYSFTVDSQAADGALVTSYDDSYYRLTARNFAILTAVARDANLLANRYDKGDGVEQNDLIEDLKRLTTNKDQMSYRGSNASEFLQCILADIALNSRRAITFHGSYQNLADTIENQRLAISGVDEDEEAVNLVKFQNGYNLASKMIQVLTEVYDRLILQTGV
jgi:flagellar hook-associated protein 1 FlgK